MSKEISIAGMVAWASTGDGATAFEAAFQRDYPVSNGRETPFEKGFAAGFEEDQAYNAAKQAARSQERMAATYDK